jgi:cytochrome P450
MSVSTNSNAASACPFPAGTPESEGSIPDFAILREHPLNPPEQIRQLRQNRGLSKVRLWDGSETWLAIHYDDVREVLGNPAFSTVTTRKGYPFVSAQRRDVLLNGRPNFTFMDAPNHTKFRRMLAKMFTVDRFARMRPAIEQIVDTQCDILESRPQPADFIQTFALEVPVRVLANLVGIPEEGIILFLKAGQTRFDLSGDGAISHATGEVLWAYLDGLLAEREQIEEQPEDVIGRLIIDQLRQGKLTRDEAILVINQLLVAGFDTTAANIAMGTVAFLTNPAQFDLLKADPSLVEMAVHEVLRYSSILQFHASRAAREDVVIGDQTVLEGEGVLALLHSANRDPAEFADPDKFDIEREAAHHLAFSFGIHQCLGQSLARLELQIVFQTLADRFPNLSLAQPVEEVDFAVHGLAYTPNSLPVTW